MSDIERACGVGLMKVSPGMKLLHLTDKLSGVAVGNDMSTKAPRLRESLHQHVGSGHQVWKHRSG